jgi:multiple sugar transport system substrate-binding protein
VRVKLVEASDRDDLLARLSTGFAGGNPPDLFLLNYRFYGQFAARDLLEPVEDRLADSDMLAGARLLRAAAGCVPLGRRAHGLPQNVSSLVVYYNKDLFRAAGVAAPRAGWTWRQFVDTAIELTDRDAGVYGLGVEPSLIRVAPFVWSNGGELVKADESAFALDTPAARDALGPLLLLRRQYGVIPGEEEVEAEDDEARFQNGRLGMVLSSRRSTPAFRTITTFDWDVAPLPRHERAAGILHSDAYCTDPARRGTRPRAPAGRPAAVRQRVPRRGVPADRGAGRGVRAALALDPQPALRAAEPDPRRTRRADSAVADRPTRRAMGRDPDGLVPARRGFPRRAGGPASGAARPL